MAKKPVLRDFYRDVKDGQFVSKEYHQTHKKTTEHERRPVPSPLPEHPSKKEPPKKG
jgi:hypothetical protein